ncbi:hypothetical protein KDA_62850 [Dictyobacter alpinus]|uniref:Uncharacterized protein n=1 Tax=Dictyobacter alpinus TaxID=2014873 RepID=A0A402BHB3_9CHLR|nr:hypothetical protein KDA_62850 [Dictyobacter alpinus]
MVDGFASERELYVQLLFKGILPETAKGPDGSSSATKILARYLTDGHGFSLLYYLLLHEPFCTFSF